MKKTMKKICYLPVEGDIQDGECFISSSHEREVFINNSSITIKSDEKYKKVEKFICCTDIKEGDKVKVTKDFFNYFDDVVVEVRDDGYFTDEINGRCTGTFYFLHQTFKISSL